LRDPRTAIVMFRVMDEHKANKNLLVGYRCAPVSLLMPGHRSVYLRDEEDGSIIPGCNLLVHVAFHTSEDEV
jgi:hypothetical protein